MTSEPNDLSAFWMPFTDNRGFKADPRMFVAARGMHYTASAGHQVLDATGGLWCVNAGHGRERIDRAPRTRAAGRNQQTVDHPAQGLAPIRLPVAARAFGEEHFLVGVGCTDLFHRRRIDPPKASRPMKGSVSGIGLKKASIPLWRCHS